MAEPLPRCPSGKRGAHDFAFFFSADDSDIPITAVCAHCGVTFQHPLKWTVGESLDDLDAQEIMDLVRATVD